MTKIISQGAEAVIYRDSDKVIKERVVKSYRLAEVDNSLRKFRTRREAKVIAKLNTLGIASPKLLNVDDKTMKIEMSFIPGDKLRDVLEVSHAYSIGKILAEMHKNDIVHGDLTTSNMILKDNAIHMIDFGLSVFSNKVEDKAVDLHLLHRALESKHNTIFEDCFKEVLRGYTEEYPDSELVLSRLEKVQARGRNKGKV